MLFVSNLLPCDGEVFYHGPIFSRVDSERFFRVLRSGVAWERDRLRMMGREIVTRREVAWYGGAPFVYRYSGAAKTAHPWTPELLDLKQAVEARTGDGFNACLLNCYHNGEEGMNWHSDDEPELVADAPIASLSLGEARRFLFRHKRTGQRMEVLLEPGSLLVMSGQTQRHWQHQLPPMKQATGARINLTFRHMSADCVGTG